MTVDDAKPPRPLVSSHSQDSEASRLVTTSLVSWTICFFSLRLCASAGTDRLSFPRTNAKILSRRGAKSQRPASATHQPGALPNLDPDRFQEPGGTIAADHREDIVVGQGEFFLAGARVHQHYLVLTYLLDRGAEVGFDLAFVDALIDLQLVAKLQIVLHVAANDQSDLIDLIVSAESDLIALSPGDQIDGRFNRRVAGAHDNNSASLVGLGVR